MIEIRDELSAIEEKEEVVIELKGEHKLLVRQYRAQASSDIYIKPEPRTYNYTMETDVSDISSLLNLIAESSTQKRSIPEVLERSVMQLLDGSRDEEFEYGYKSKLETSIEGYIKNYGDAAVQALHSCLAFGMLDEDVVVEVLHSIGKNKDEGTHQQRLILLLFILSRFSGRVRCGAALGLAYLDDPRAIGHLENALATEASENSKVYLHRVLEQLLTTARN